MIEVLAIIGIFSDPSLSHFSSSPLPLQRHWAVYLTAISTSVTAEERLDAIGKAIDSFQHDLQSVHDAEVAVGADSALCKHLAFLFLLEQHEKSSTREVALTLQAMESVYKASSATVDASFKRMGNEVLKLLVVIVDAEVKKRSAAASVPLEPTSSIVEESAIGSDGDSILQNLTKILGHFARTGDATQPMARFPGLLSSLVQLISINPYERIPWQARLSALWVLANLACNADNMVLMAQTTGLIDCLVTVASRPRNAATDSMSTAMEILRSKSISSRAILNLSWADENKSTLIDSYPQVLNLLCELATLRTDAMGTSRTVAEILQATRCHAVGALRNLAAGPRKVVLCDNTHLLDVLTDAALNDPVVQERALAAIHNLAVPSTASRLVARPALVMALKGVLTGNALGNASEEKQNEIRHHASATLQVLERSVTPTMDSYQNLKELMDEINASSQPYDISQPRNSSISMSTTPV